VITVVLIVAASLTALGGVWVWRRRAGASLSDRLAAAPIPVERLRARLTREWGAPVEGEPTTWAIDELTATVATKDRGYVVTVRWPLGAPGRLGELRIRPRQSRAVTVERGLSPQTVRMLERPSNPLGDAVFDASLRLDCGLAVALPLLTPEVLPRVCRPQSLTLTDGVLTCEVGGAAVEPAQAVAAIAGVVELAQSLCRAATTPPEVALAVGARAHRSTAVRLKSLQELEDRFPAGEVLQDALRVAQRDPAPIVRLEAGQALGAAGRDGLWALALDAHAPESLRVAALLALTRGDGGFDADETRLAGLIAPRIAPTLTVTALRLAYALPSAPHQVVAACRALASDEEEVLLTAIGFLEDRGDAAASGPLSDVAGDASLPERVRRHAARVVTALARPAPTLTRLRPAPIPPG